MTGTATIVIAGNCTWTGLGRLRMNLTFNSTGTITIPDNYTFDGSGYIMTYTAGSVVAPSIIYFASTRTYDVAGITWQTLIFDNASTITLLSKLTANIITIDATIIFTGTEGWECNILNLGVTANIGRTVTLEDLITYKVNNDFNSIRSTNSSRAVLQSSDATNRAIFTCGESCVLNIGYTNAIRIDSSLGKKVYSFNGVFTSTLNWDSSVNLTTAFAYQS
jgi:hypothetical protein